MTKKKTKKKVIVQVKMSLEEKLMNIQAELKVPKGKFNEYANFNYRSGEDILQAVKPILKKYKSFIIMNDDLVLIGNRYYVKATISFLDTETNTGRDIIAFAREEETKKGMDGSQITGASSSYARKYALNGLFGIDDSKDSDVTNDGKTEKKAVKAEKLVTNKDMKGIAKFLQEINNVKGSKELALIGSRLKAGVKVKFNENQIKVLKVAYTSKLKQFAVKK